MLNFAEPEYAYLLFVLPLLALLKIGSDRLAAKAVAAFASSERLRQPLLGGASPLWSGFIFGLQMLGLAFIIIAMTRPQYGREESDTPQSGRNVFIAIDTSKSMLAPDVLPNRLTRAKLAAEDLLEKLSGDRVGVVAFAGRAFLQAPLTTDHDAVRQTIDALDHTTIPRGGSSLASAIELVLDTVEKNKSDQRRCGMILFTDGQETDDGTRAAAKKAAEKHLLILPVGMGTAEGALIPDPDPMRQGENIRDENGRLVMARLEAGLLQEVATLTGGRYVELARQPLSQDAVDSLLSQLDRQEADSRHESLAIERYQWPLCLGIICLVSSMLLRPSSRKRVKPAALPIEPAAEVHHHSHAAAVILALGLLTGRTVAKEAAEDAVRQAHKDYDGKNYEGARDGFSKALKSDKPPAGRDQLYYGLGAAELQLKNYAGAFNAFSEALQSPDERLQERALRGLGTSLYAYGGTKLQQVPDDAIKAWEDACTHFQGAMKLMDSDHANDATEYAELKENYEQVKKMLDLVKKQREQKQQQQKGKKKQKGEKGAGEPDQGEQGDGDDQKEKEGRDKNDQLKKQEQLPGGQLRAAEGNQKPENMKPADEKVDDQTGFSPQQAREQLRNYADDQKSAQYLMRREAPANGKDY